MTYEAEEILIIEDEAREGRSLSRFVFKTSSFFTFRGW